jgi:hypothetical protein
LADLRNSIRKWTAAEKEALYQHYKKELQRLKTARQNGETGRLEFTYPERL